MSMEWFDKAVEEIEQDYDNGNISNKEYNEQMRELRCELRGAAEQHAEDAYTDYLGG